MKNKPTKAVAEKVLALIKIKEKQKEKENIRKSFCVFLLLLFL